MRGRILLLPHLLALRLALEGVGRRPHRHRPEVAAHRDGLHLNVLGRKVGVADGVKHDAAKRVILVVAGVDREVLVDEVLLDIVELEHAVHRARG